MSMREDRPRVFVSELIKPGDIILTTTPEPVSQMIRKIIGADISHAMICVANASVIDSTGDGVHARNLQRFILEPGCAGHVLRPLKPLTNEQLRSVVSFARAAIGTRYTRSGAAKSVLAGFVAGRRQFCSRLVAQAYRDAGVALVSDADFCHPGELLESAALVEVPDVLRVLNPKEEAYWREDIDNVRTMRESINTLLDEARELSSDIETMDDIDAYLIEHPEGDEHLVRALESSKFLELWRDEYRRNLWQYDADLMEGFHDSKARIQRYCEELLADEDVCENRFIVNHAGYVTLNTLHPRRYFELKIGLYATLTELHTRRIKAAAVWLGRRGLVENTPPTLLRPHTPEWFESLRKWNPKQAAMTESAIQTAGSIDACGVCGDEPARDYVLQSQPAAGPGTLRLCDDCFRIRSPYEPMKSF